MKRTLLLSLLLSFSCLAFAQENKTYQADSLNKQIKEIHVYDKRSKGEVRMTEILSDPLHRGVYQRSETPRFRGHWSGFNFGFVNFANTNYARYNDNEFMDLEWKNSFVMQFNVFQYSMRLNRLNNMGLVTGLGLEYQRLRFRQKNSIVRGENGIILPLTLDHVKKSSLKNLYLTLPLIFEWQFPSKKYQRAYIATGFIGGLRLHTKTKTVYKNENGDSRRLKSAGDFSMNPVKVDAIVRVGYSKLALWGTYTLNRMLKVDKGPELHPYAIGLGINF